MCCLVLCWGRKLHPQLEQLPLWHPEQPVPLPWKLPPLLKAKLEICFLARAPQSGHDTFSDSAREHSFSKRFPQPAQAKS